eukprot:TRINITY_DN9971_c0_g1_i1.p1 TRINITY_DN9971_c0_g1~~TRINITY_DN9971_c0_g1_i1.p1  ORF type:complete len:383 (+),score=65.63 TRINITY_DN9971_c0_g1_i1:209-1357(+)
MIALLFRGFGRTLAQERESSLFYQVASVWNMAKDPDLEKALKRNNRWIINNKLKTILQMCPDHCASVKFLQKRANSLPIHVKVLNWVQKYPSLFEIYTENLETWCRMSKKLQLLVAEEAAVKIQQEPALTERLVKILMLSQDNRLNVVKFGDLRKYFGFPDDYVSSIAGRDSQRIRVLEHKGKKTKVEIELVEWDKSLAISAIERKQVAEYECRLPSEGWKTARERFEEFQRTRYVSPYIEGLKGLETPQGFDEKEKEKWVVGVIHELLSLTLWKRMSIDKLRKFSREFRLPDDLVRLLLRHPGIFYVSNQNDVHTVVLRDAYFGKELVVKDPLVIVKEKFGDIMQEDLLVFTKKKKIAHLNKRKANQPFLKMNLSLPRNGK